MRPLRWKSRFRVGDAEVDRRNRDFVDCFNSLVDAAGQREHCREMEDLIDGLETNAEQMLQEKTNRDDMRAQFGRRLLAALPLSAYGGSSCRSCGVCDLIEDKIAENLKAPADCLFTNSSPRS